MEKITVVDAPYSKVMLGFESIPQFVRDEAHSKSVISNEREFPSFRATTGVVGN